MALVWFSGFANSSTYDSKSETVVRIVVGATWLPWTMTACAVMGALALVIFAPRSASGWMPSRGFAVFALVLVLWAALIAWVFRNGGWRALETRRTSEGHDYALLHRSIWMDSDWALARVADVGVVSTTYDAVAYAAGGSPGDDPYAAVVRPAGSGKRTLFFSGDGLVVACFGDRCYVAGAMDGSRPISGDALFALSPFLVLDATTQGDEGDVNEVCAAVTRRAKSLHDLPTAREDLGLPSDESLLAALDHANPWVRAAARRIVESGGAAMYPQATKRLASAPK